MMSREYVFEFSGTKEDFFNKLNSFHNNSGEFYFFDNYIVEKVNDEVRFGVERAGHSGGHWFVPTITEYEDKIELKGTIEYIGTQNNSTNSKEKRFIEKVREILLYILVLPLALVVFLFMKIHNALKWIVQKIRRQPIVKVENTEEKLFYLMENHLGCVRK